MFSDLITILEDNGKGILALHKFAEAARQRAQESGENAAAWVLLATYASEFTDTYERMPISIERTAQLFDQLVQETERLDQAYETKDPVKMLAAVNMLAANLTNSSN